MIKILWVKRALFSVLLLCTAIAGGLWLFALTAKCESFGCIAVGLAATVAVAFHFLAAAAGGALVWVLHRGEAQPNWLVVLEVLNILPVMWFGFRLMTGP